MKCMFVRTYQKVENKNPKYINVYLTYLFLKNQLFSYCKICVINTRMKFNIIVPHIDMKINLFRIILNF